jgi:hypothetical protein
MMMKLTLAVLHCEMTRQPLIVEAFEIESICGRDMLISEGTASIPKPLVIIRTKSGAEHVVEEDWAEVEKRYKQAMGGTGHSIMA